MGIYGTSGNDLIDALDGVTNGNDQIYGYEGHDTIWGLGGNDIILGGEGLDDILGGSGNDLLKGGGGADELNGGSGIDEANYTDSWEGVIVFLSIDVATGGTAEGDTFHSIEDLTGSEYDDTLFGDYNENVLIGRAGNDALTGGGGDDVLYGDGGNDTLKGGGGGDSLNGGFGIDTATYSESPAGVVISLLTDEAAYGEAEGDELNSIENVTGSAFMDNLSGSDGVNVLRGMGGSDTLYGLGGNDTLHGEDGHDFLSGGAGADIMIGGIGFDTYLVDHLGDTVTEFGGQGTDSVYTSVSWTLTPGADVEMLSTTNFNGVEAINLTGNASGNELLGNNGNNVLNGGGGNDELMGLGGSDSFLFDTALSAAFNLDVITDFSVADDTIRLDDAIFSAFANGPLAAERFVVGTAALDASDNIIYDDAIGVIYYDSDGNGAAAAVQFAQVSAGLALTHLDFIVV